MCLEPIVYPPTSRLSRLGWILVAVPRPLRADVGCLPSGRAQTIAVLEDLLPNLHERGYEVVTLSELVEREATSEAPHTGGPRSRREGPPSET